jgi:C1A family cysteine protease
MKATVDWRTKGWVTRVKDQGGCGNCYAFSAIGVVEAQYKNLTGKLVDLSVSQVVDCSKGYGNFGCGGGKPDKSFAYIKDNGLEGEKDYP